jgi:hypothetical protein
MRMDIAFLTPAEFGCTHDQRERRRIPRGWDNADEPAHTSSRPG